MRLVGVISSLGAGGAERVLSTLMNHWAGMGRQVTILTFDDGSRPPFYDLDPRVEHLPLGITRVSASRLAGLANNLRRIRIVRRAIRGRQPDALITFIDTTNVVALLATRGLGVPVVVSEHIDPYTDEIPRIWRNLRRLTYRWSAQVVVLNERARGYFSPRVRALTTVIPNPVVLDRGPGPSPDEPVPRPLVVSMGRLSQGKGHDLLLQAFARLRERFPEWTLMVLGEGPWRSKLEALRERLALSGRVHLPGTMRYPHALLRQADLFVFPSRHREGFPMALCEALACGLPVVTAEYHSGVRDIVRDGVDGLIVPREDVEALTAAMGRLMADETERARFGRRAVEITTRYGLERVMAMWEDLLRRVTATGRGSRGTTQR